MTDAYFWSITSAIISRSDRQPDQLTRLSLGDSQSNAVAAMQAAEGGRTNT